MMIGLISILFILYTRHCIWVTSTSYSHPSIVLESSDQYGNRRIVDDYRAGYYWLRQNTKPVSFVLSNFLI